MRQKLFLTAFAVVFSMLVCVQGYFLLIPDAGLSLRANRLNASLTDPLAEAELAGEKIAGLSVYLTMETDGDAVSGATLLVNGVAAGDFKKGILCVKVEDGDVLSLRDGEGVTVTIDDYPENLKETALAPSLTAKSKVCPWGTVQFK